MRTLIHSPFHFALAFVALILAFAMAESGAYAVENATTGSTNQPSVQIPKSDFVIPSNISQGRDPFYPLSRRLVMNANTKSNEPVKVAVTLSLKGVSGTEAKRFALINDKTFAAGEERDISVGNGKVRVHCLEIQEDSAVVEVNGTRQVLRLRPGL